MLHAIGQLNIVHIVSGAAFEASIEAHLYATCDIPLKASASFQRAALSGRRSPPLLLMTPLLHLLSKRVGDHTPLDSHALVRLDTKCHSQRDVCSCFFAILEQRLF